MGAAKTGVARRLWHHGTERDDELLLHSKNGRDDIRLRDVAKHFDDGQLGTKKDGGEIDGVRKIVGKRVGWLESAPGVGERGGVGRDHLKEKAACVLRLLLQATFRLDLHCLLCCGNGCGSEDDALRNGVESFGLRKGVNELYRQFHGQLL